MAEHPGNSTPDAPSPPPPARSPAPLTSPPDPSFSAPPPPEQPVPSGPATAPSTDRTSSDVQSATVPATAALPAGPIEAGPIEAGPIEAGPIEAGPVEAGPVEAGTEDWDVTPAVDPWAESDESWYAQQYPATLRDVGNLPPTAVDRPAGMPPTTYDHRAGLPPTAYDRRAEHRPAGFDGGQPGAGDRAANPTADGVPRGAAHPSSGYASVPVPPQQQAGVGQQRPAPPPALLRPPKPSRKARRAAARAQKAAMNRASAARPAPPAPPAQRPLPPPGRRKRRWFRRFLVFCLLVTLCCCGVPAWYGWSWAKQYPVSASVPAGIGDLSLRTDGDSQTAAADLAAEAQRRGNVDATGFGGIYTDGRGRRIIVYGTTSLRWSPNSDLRAELGRLGGDYGFDEADAYDSGESGLFVRCADGRKDDVRVAVCGWADHGSLGTVLFSRRKADDVASDVTTIRLALLSRGLSVPGL